MAEFTSVPISTNPAPKLSPQGPATAPQGQEDSTATAVVSIGTVSIGGPSLFTQQGSTLYTDYIIRNKFQINNRLYMLGVTSPNPFNGASAAFVQLAAPTILWIVDWTTCQFGGIPAIPEASPPSTLTTHLGSNQWILLNQNIEPGTIMLGPDATAPLYRISGTYYYGATAPNAKPLMNVRFSRPPWLQKTVFDQAGPGKITTQRNLFGLEQ